MLWPYWYHLGKTMVMPCWQDNPWGTHVYHLRRHLMMSLVQSMPLLSWLEYDGLWGDSDNRLRMVLVCQVTSHMHSPFLCDLSEALARLEVFVIIFFFDSFKHF